MTELTTTSLPQVSTGSPDSGGPNALLMQNLGTALREEAAHSTEPALRRLP
jgi:hypothetical protein